MEKTIKVLSIDPKSTNVNNIIPSEIIIKQEFNEKLTDIPEWFTDFIIKKSMGSNPWEIAKLDKPILNKSTNHTNLIPVLIKRLISYCIPIIKADFVSKSRDGENIVESNISLGALNKEFANYRIASNDLTNIVGLYLHILENNALTPIYEGDYNKFRDIEKVGESIASVANSGRYTWVDTNNHIVLLGPSSNSNIYSSAKAATTRLTKFVWDDMSMKGLDNLTRDLYKMIQWSYRNISLLSKIHLIPLSIGSEEREKNRSLQFKELDSTKLKKFWNNELSYYIDISSNKNALEVLNNIFPISNKLSYDILQLSHMYGLSSVVESIYLYGLNNPKVKDSIDLLIESNTQHKEIISQRKQIFQNTLNLIYMNKYSHKLFQLPYVELSSSQQDRIKKQMDSLDKYDISNTVSKIFTNMRIVITNFYNNKNPIITLKQELEKIFNLKSLINKLHPIKKSIKLSDVEEIVKRIEGGKASKPKPKAKSNPKLIAIKAIKTKTETTKSKTTTVTKKPTKSKPTKSKPTKTATITKKPSKTDESKTVTNKTKPVEPVELIHINTDIGILCPHWIEYLDFIINMKPKVISSSGKKDVITGTYDISEAKRFISNKWGMENTDYSSNEGRWCKTCGEKLQEIAEQDISVANVEHWQSDDEDNHIKQSLWGELQNSVKFIKFTNSSNDPFKIIDYLINALTPYLKNVYLEIQKNRSLNENESKLYLSIYSSMYIYASLAKLIIENTGMNWNVKFKKSRKTGGGSTNTTDSDTDNYIVTGGRDNKKIITEAYYIIYSIKKVYIENIPNLTTEKFKSLFMEVFNTIYNIDEISFKKSDEMEADTADELGKRYNYLLGMTPVYHYAYKEAVLYSGKSVDYTDLNKILGTDTPKKWVSLTIKERAMSIPIYKHPPIETGLADYTKIFNMSGIYGGKAKKVAAKKVIKKTKPPAVAKKQILIATTVVKKEKPTAVDKLDTKPTRLVITEVTNNPFELYLDFYKDDIYKEYLTDESEPLNLYYQKLDLFRKKHEQVYDVMKYLKFMPQSAQIISYNRVFKDIQYKKIVITAAEKQKLKKNQAFDLFQKFCPYFLPKKRSHVYTGTQSSADGNEFDNIKKPKCVKCGWEKLYIKNQPDSWYKKWNKKMISKTTKTITVFEDKDITKWDLDKKFPVWKISTIGIMKLSKISGISTNFWENLGLMEDFYIDDIVSGKKNPHKAIADDRLDQSEQGTILDRINKVDSHIMWIYTRLLNIKYYSSMNFNDLTSDPIVLEILKKGKTKNLEKNINSPIPNYKDQLAWYMYNQPYIKTLNFTINQLSNLLVYIKELKEYKYISREFFKYCIDHIKSSELLMSKVNLAKYYATISKEEDPNGELFTDDAAVGNQDENFAEYDMVNIDKSEDPDMVDTSEDPEGRDTDLGFQDVETDNLSPFDLENAGFDNLNDGADDTPDRDDL